MMINGEIIIIMIINNAIYCSNKNYYSDNYCLLYWLTKETLQTFFANGSTRNVEIWYLLNWNEWIIAAMLFASSIFLVYDWRFIWLNSI